MKPIPLLIRSLLLVAGVAVVGAASADPPIPITADEAFDAVQRQVFPGTTDGASVVLADVRDPSEVFSSGAAAAVTKIELVTGGGPILPDFGKVRLAQDENGEPTLAYTVDGAPMSTLVGDVQTVVTEPIAVNVPFWRWTEVGWKKHAKNFYPVIGKLARDFDVLILYCRTGGRSSLAGDGVDPGLFVGGVYEIDDPDGQNGRGGLSGPDYGKVYNGYAGFPGRLTPPDPQAEAHGSVSWVDSGLPLIRESKVLP